MKDFEKQLENMAKPLGAVESPNEIKLAIVNAQRSATLGIWFIIVPCYFLFCAFLFYFFHLDHGFFGSIFVLLSMLENKAQWMAPIVLVGLPLISFVLNALAISHFSVDRADGMIYVNIRLRWLNIVILLVRIAIVSLFIAYAFILNIHVK
jgi:lantibiotic transport system permease protein